MPQQDYGRLSGRLIRKRCRMAARRIDGRSVLDAGCNIGDLADAIPPNVDYLGLERVPEIVDLARRLRPERRFIVADLEAPWPVEAVERRFDHVVMLAVLEHVGDPAGVLARAREVLTPRGSVILTTPHPRAQRLHEGGARVGLFSRDAEDEHERFLGRAEISQAARKAGLRVARYRRFQLGMNQLAVLVDRR